MDVPGVKTQSGRDCLARPKKEQKKASPEERLMDRWNQQVFFLKKQFPRSDIKINAIRKNYEKRGGPFFPTEEAVNDLIQLYFELKGPLSAPGQQPNVSPLL